MTGLSRKDAFFGLSPLAALGLVAVFSIAAFAIFLRPLNPQPWQWADDNLYFRLAQSIAAGPPGVGWLGLLDELTLAKAPVFPLFLAAVHNLGLPLRLSEFALFLPLPFLFRRATSATGSPRGAILFFAAALLVFVPAAGVDLRLLRTTLSSSLTLYCLVCLVGFVVSCDHAECRIWPWGLAAGLSFGLAATTREEQLWLLLPIVVGVALSSTVVWRTRRFASFAAAVGALIVGYFLPIVTISALNYHSYRVFSTSLRQNLPFREMHSRLSSIRAGSRDRFVPVNEAARREAYRYSPHFASLQPYLEGPATDDLARNRMHLAWNNWDPDRREFFFTTFQFALIRAIFLSGRSEGEAVVSFCRIVSQELGVAAEEGKLSVGHGGLFLLPPLAIADFPEVVGSSLKSFSFLALSTGLRRRQADLSKMSGRDAAWHRFLKTRPVPVEPEGYGSLRLKNRILGLGVTVNRIFFPLALVLGVAASVILAMNRPDGWFSMISVLAVGWTAVAAFCVMLGVMDTVAFPVLKWPGGYNLLGSCAMHFLVLASTLAVGRVAGLWLAPGASRQLTPTRSVAP